MGELQKILVKKRKELKLSLREASNLIGISHSYLSTLEKGVDPRTGTPVRPTPETLKLISDAYEVDYEALMMATGYIFERSGRTNRAEDGCKKKLSIKEKYPEVHDVEEAWKIILEQPGLMLKGNILSDESKIILANAIQMGLRTAEEIEKKRKNKDENEQ